MKKGHPPQVPEFGHPCPDSGTSEHAEEVDTMSTDARYLRHLPIANGSGFEASAVDVTFTDHLERL